MASVSLAAPPPQTTIHELSIAPVSSTTHEISIAQQQAASNLSAELLRQQLALGNYYQSTSQQVWNVAQSAGITQNPAPIIGQPIVGVPILATPSGAYPGSIQPAAARSVTAPIVNYGNGYSSADIQAMLNQVSASTSQAQAVNSAQLSQLMGIVQNALSVRQHEMSDSIGNITVNITNPIQREIADNSSQIENAIARVSDNFSNALFSIARDLAPARDAISDSIVREITQSSEETAAIARQGQHELSTALAEQTSGLHEISNSVESFERRFFSGETVPVVVSFADFKRDAQNAAQGVGETFHAQQSTVSDWLKGIAGGLFPGINPFIDLISGGLPINLPNFAEAWKKFEQGEYKNLDEFLAGLGQGAIGEEFLRILFGVVGLVSVVLNTSGALGKPIAEAFSQLAWANNPSRINDTTTLITYLFRNPDFADYVRDLLHKQGLNDEQVQILLDASASILPFDAVRQLFLRGEIKESEHDKDLTALGYDDRSIKQFKSLYNVIPPIPDLIRMSVRDVFNIDRATRYGQFEEYPQLLTRFARMLGLSEEWSRRYWAAHWELPSAQQGFEMLHRGLITRAELDELLTALDVMPRWKAPLVGITFNPLTRVDIRRMYKAGVLTDDMMHTAHLATGYNEENARLLDEFVKRTQLPEDETDLDKFRKRGQGAVETAYKNNKLTRDEARNRLLQLGMHADQVDEVLHILELEKPEIAHADRVLKQANKAIDLVIKNYVAGFLPRHEAHNQLRNLGFSESQAEIELGYLDLEYDIEQKEKIVKYAETLYIAHQIDGAGLASLLGSQGFTLNEINDIAAYLNIQRQHKDKRPTDKDIIKFFAMGIIDLSTFYTEMRGFGYEDKYINWFAAEVAKSLQ